MDKLMMEKSLYGQHSMLIKKGLGKAGLYYFTQRNLNLAYN